HNYCGITMGQVVEGRYKMATSARTTSPSLPHRSPSCSCLRHLIEAGGRQGRGPRSLDSPVWSFAWLINHFLLRDVLKLSGLCCFEAITLVSFYFPIFSACQTELV
uniref:Uncharacterized protein n=1 Tax=Cyclopterus lumpus TaxID=8103 RepID=A0A8C3AFZ9_CYCLU